MKGGLGDLMKQAKEMQQKLKQAQEQLTNMVVSGVAGGGLVTVKMNGRHDVKDITIDPSALVEDKEVLEDLITAAVNDAVRKVEKETGERVKGLAAGMQLPDDLDLPNDES